MWHKKYIKTERAIAGEILLNKFLVNKISGYENVKDKDVSGRIIKTINAFKPTCRQREIIKGMMCIGQSV